MISIILLLAALLSLTQALPISQTTEPDAAVGINWYTDVILDGAPPAPQICFNQGQGIAHWWTNAAMDVSCKSAVEYSNGWVSSAGILTSSLENWSFCSFPGPDSCQCADAPRGFYISMGLSTSERRTHTKSPKLLFHPWLWTVEKASLL